VTAVIDLVNRDRGVLAALATGVLARGGRVASTGHAADADALSAFRTVNVRAEADRAAMALLGELAGSGRLRAPVTRTFGIDEIDSAFAALRDGALGKIAVRM
jgi:NADPH:quinone reductase-like Zn-dependent oxidoreductase